jgi:uncharacterized protein (UPF0332 family)
VTPEQYLAKAERALTSARLLLRNGDVDGACNRAYYAMFDAAQAALLRHRAGLNPAETRTHSGLITAFGQHLIKTGIIAPELGRALNQVERIRRLADYIGEEIQPDRAAWVVEQAASFVDAIQNDPNPKTP